MVTTNSELLGNECKVYISDTVTTKGDALVDKVRDNELSLGASTVDKTSRADLGWKGQRAGLKNWGVSFDMIYDSANAAWGKLEAAYHTGLPIGVSIVDGLIATGKGIHGKAFVTEFTRGEPMDDVVTTKVTLVGDGKPTYGVAPA